MPQGSPSDRPTVIPRIVTGDVDGLLGFARAVFGNQVDRGGDGPVELWFGDSLVLVSDGGGAREAFPAFLYVYVPNTDAAYDRALAAGARSAEPPGPTPWGDRRATVADAFGNLWQIATAGAA